MWFTTRGRQSPKAVQTIINANESSTRRTIHADVNTRKGVNGELFVDSISQNSQNDKAFGKDFLKF